MTTPPTEAADVLDRMANPHPRLWDEAVASYRRAVAGEHTTADVWHWFGMWDAMLAATGYEPERLFAELTVRLELSRSPEQVAAYRTSAGRIAVVVDALLAGGDRGALAAELEAVAGLLLA